jgi:hypothetical protein
VIEIHTNVTNSFILHAIKIAALQHIVRYIFKQLSLYCRFIFAVCYVIMSSYTCNFRKVYSYCIRLYLLDFMFPPDSDKVFQLARITSPVEQDSLTALILRLPN